MFNSLSRNASWYLEFYKDFVQQSWNEITFWQYIGLMVAMLVVGYLWMSKGSTGHA